jgi:AraC-like DNA-binding protein
MMIHAFSKNVAYPEHWGSLSIKSTFSGTEYYHSGSCRYAVNPTNYLIFNNGKTYSSHIYSNEEVESFTINFSPGFERTIVNGYLRSPETNLDSPVSSIDARARFIEKLYANDRFVTPTVRKLRKLASDFGQNREAIQELYVELLLNMLGSQESVWKEIGKIKAIKPSTKVELYRRLFQARDYIESCYAENINLEGLACISCLNTAYFLRQFKGFFGTTPHKYLIRKRMEVALKLFEDLNKSVTEVCYETGYTDPTSFGKLFKKYHGVSPEQYQREKTNKSIFTL